jgi:YcxB-like protein
MEVRFIPSKEDVMDVLRVASMPPWGMFTFVLLLALLFVVGIYLVDHDFRTVGYVWLGMSAAVGLATYEVPRFQARRAITSNPSAHGEITYSFEEGGVNVVHPTGTSHLGWRAFTRFRETERLFLLYFSSSRYSFLPKRVMSSEQAKELREILGSRIGRVPR